MIWYDWLILILPVSFVMWMGLRSRRYVRGVSDFLSAGRLCGRYVISMGDVANALSIIGLVSYIEIHYRTGFSVGFWGSILAPLSIVMGLTGFVTYRFAPETWGLSLRDTGYASEMVFGNMDGVIRFRDVSGARFIANRYRNGFEAAAFCLNDDAMHRPAWDGPVAFEYEVRME